MKININRLRHFVAIVLTTIVFQKAYSGDIVVDVALNPVGDFKAKSSAVVGQAVKTTMSGTDSFSAENIRIDLKTIKTGIELRDTHMYKYLESDKHPEVILLKASGQNGKGQGRLKLHGIEKDVSGTYKLLNGGKVLSAEFKANLSDFKVENINYKGLGVEDEIKVQVTLPVVSSEQLNKNPNQPTIDKDKLKQKPKLQDKPKA